MILSLLLLSENKLHKAAKRVFKYTIYRGNFTEKFCWITNSIYKILWWGNRRAVSPERNTAKAVLRYPFQQRAAAIHFTPQICRQPLATNPVWNVYKKKIKQHLQA